MVEESFKNEDELIGKVIHYFGNIGVAIVELKKPLKEGDVIRIVGGLTDFTQSVSSMEIEHQKVSEAKAGESIGLKVDQKVKEGYKVYKV
jgi:translation elongation factor EF-Tu-like GTPase